MNAGQAVKAVFKERGLSQADYCRESGRARSNVSRSLAHRDIASSDAADMLAFAGYRLVAVPVGAKLPEGCYEIGGRDA